MIYINTKTGAIIDSPCIISGEDWEIKKEEKNEISEEIETEEEKDNKKQKKSKK